MPGRGVIIIAGKRGQESRGRVAMQREESESGGIQHRSRPLLALPLAWAKEGGSDRQSPTRLPWDCVSFFGSAGAGGEMV